MKYYQINTVNQTVKSIDKTQALKKLYNRDFIEWYYNDNYSFIADCSAGRFVILAIILEYMRLKELSIDITDLIDEVMDR